MTSATVCMHGLGRKGGNGAEEQPGWHGDVWLIIYIYIYI